MTNKLRKDQYSPSLFDITQDIVGTLPLKLIAKWMESEQTQEVAQQLLEPYKVKGYSVSSDSVGLTKLTKQKGLLEILAIINQPKEILYGFGIALGGYGVGIWAADNTQMFYPASVNPETLLSALLTIQREISKNCQIQIGIGAHYGDFYYINGGLYGLEADTIEEITENETEGGEIAISQGFYQRLPSNHNFTIVQKDEVETIIGNIFRVLDGPILADVPPGNKQYPIPYSQIFYADLIAYQNRQNDPIFRQELADKYLQNKVVVLIERENKDTAAPDVFMFTNLAFSAKMKDIGLRLLAESNGEEIKVIGSLGIYIFDEAIAAFNFAQAFRYELAVLDITTRIGIDTGQVLISDLAVGGKDIAGMPVNIASKMAQDQGEFGKLYVNSTIKELLDLREFTEITYTVSGVEITAYQG
ncbi:family 3 adenylate cyclase [Cylindrospermum stagnale PCC 7417]|uniref:Family 3 adenylate cyclase n=1 Tax=Cylindrospermum stagnale PCC 7417 TaxID=56107 RepID=K9WW17_9NOST|nr:family 3 adenylate cyclase [Cylindrospermum stagnale]AFZ24408.1 family 3 adenylate cyclase [Cylindrospermum stagnale PCC 7417]